MNAIAFLGLVWGMKAAQVSEITGAHPMPDGDLVLVRELAGRKAVLSFGFVQKTLHTIQIIFVDKDSYVDDQFFLEAQVEDPFTSMDSFQQLASVLEETFGLPYYSEASTDGLFVTRWLTTDTDIEISNTPRAGTAVVYTEYGRNPAKELTQPVINY